MSTPNYYEDWELDGLGNWKSVWKNSQTPQTRTHSDFNEIVYHGGPVSHWKLNETTGTTASDSVGDNDGTVSGASWTSSGKIDYALELDGTDDYVQITESDSSLSTANFGGTDTGKVTIAAWVYVDDRYQYNIVAEYIGGLRYFTAGRPSTGKLMCRFYNNDTQSAYSPTSDAAVPQGVWTHVAVVVEAGVGYRFYIDGEKDSGSAEHTGVRLYNYTSSNTKYLGIAHFSPYDKFDGKLDNVMVFNRALSDSEIKYLYESTDEDDLTELVHDDAGNLTLDHRGYSYAYDYENRLIRIEKRGDGGDPDTVAKFEYDALGRRIEKIDSIAATTTQYYYEGWRVLCETDENGDVQRRYTYGNYLDETLILTDSTGASDVDYYYAHNHLYSPVALMEDDGDVVERYEYDAYGKPTIYNYDFSQTYDTSQYDNPYLFTGRRVDNFDSDSLRLQYNRNRYYDYDTGRWLTHDPIGYVDGLNMYEYVNSMPTISYDPYGLASAGDCQKGCKEVDNGFGKNLDACYTKCLMHSGSYGTMSPTVAQCIGRLIYFGTNWDVAKEYCKRGEQRKKPPPRRPPVRPPIPSKPTPPCTPSKPPKPPTPPKPVQPPPQPPEPPVDTGACTQEEYDYLACGADHYCQGPLNCRSVKSREEAREIHDGIGKCIKALDALMKKCYGGSEYRAMQQTWRYNRQRLGDEMKACKKCK